MMSIRSRLRRWTAGWLICQAAFLAALLPPDCCRVHDAGSVAGTPGCHEQSGPVEACPLHRAAQAPCPTHGAPAKDDACHMRGTCNGPLTAVLALFSEPGVARSRFAIRHDPRTISAVASLSVDPSSRSILPHTPPPRA